MHLDLKLDLLSAVAAVGGTSTLLIANSLHLLWTFQM
jgi:hypothetical protein